MIAVPPSVGKSMIGALETSPRGVGLVVPPPGRGVGVGVARGVGVGDDDERGVGLGDGAGSSKPGGSNDSCATTGRAITAASATPASHPVRFMKRTVASAPCLFALSNAKHRHQCRSTAVICFASNRR